MATHRKKKTSDSTGRLPPDHPDFDSHGIAFRLGQAISTVKTWECRCPEKLPPSVKIGRVRLYNKIIAEQWLAEQREAHRKGHSRAEPTPKQTSTGKRRGKPTREEADAARAMGLSVPAWRAKFKGAE